MRKTTRLLIHCLIVWALSGCTKEADKIWDMNKLSKVIDYAKEIESFALMVQSDGETLTAFGDVIQATRVHSIRKAILSALVFQHLDKIDLQATLADLNIQDYPIPLTELQRTAKVIHLLKSTSGINHPTGSQVGSMQANRDNLLGQEPNVPGEKWAYNNWDYNVLTTIFEQETGLTIAEAFSRGIAQPLGIKDFEVFYRTDTTLSMHSKAGIRLSARDMAKFGQLYLNRGKWRGREIIPAEWIDKISTDYTRTVNQSDERYGHGYLWWVPADVYAGGIPKGSYIATGAWGQRIVVIPEWQTVIVHKTMTEVPAKERIRVSSSKFERLIRLIADARMN